MRLGMVSSMCSRELTWVAFLISFGSLWTMMVVGLLSVCCVV